MVERIKMLTLRALVSDPKLMYGLVLKGGNALQMAYEMSDRASMDIDFSMDRDFTPEEFSNLQRELSGILNAEFGKEGLMAFDVGFIEKPRQGKIPEWKGYLLSFKVIDGDRYDPDDIEKNRREAYAIYPNHSQIFKVEISSFEYTAAKKLIDARGAIFYVYTPEMIVFEKIRALCQSMPEYKEIVPSSRPKGRARDVYDIWNICQKYTIDAGAPDNKRMFREIFRAKRVPLDFLDLLPNYRGFQKEDWVNVLNTLTHEDEKGFGFYFDHMIQLAQTLKTP